MSSLSTIGATISNGLLYASMAAMEAAAARTNSKSASYSPSETQSIPDPVASQQSNNDSSEHTLDQTIFMVAAGIFACIGICMLCGGGRGSRSGTGGFYEAGGVYYVFREDAELAERMENGNSDY